MRVFVHEFITSGALAGQPLPASLLREGAAMRRAVVLDLLKMGDLEVVATRDDRVPATVLPGLTEFIVSTPDEETRLFAALCRESDRTLVIAPELEGELGRRVALACKVAGPERVLNSLDLVATASDKWETGVRLRRAGIPSIETHLGSSDEWRRWDDAITKPRDGAGSQGVRRLRPEEQQAGDDLILTDQWIVQPFITGRWLSCTILFHPGGGHDLFPPAEQRIASDGTFAYQGGVMPAPGVSRGIESLAWEAIHAVANDVTAIIGPVGVDLVENEATGELLVCEVNPRFTTSYVAARELSRTNLLQGLFHREAPRAEWRPDRVEFTADGQFRSL